MTNPVSAGVKRGPKPKPGTRENLIRAGLKMLHESGYAATGIKEIVDEAEVPKGSFYNHFESKEAFGRAVVDHYFGQGIAKMQAKLEDSAVPPLQRLKNYFEQRVRDFEGDGYARGCLLGNMSSEVADHSHLIREGLSTHFQTWSQLFEACIAQAQASRAIQTTVAPSALASFILNSWEGALVRMRADKSVVPLQQFIDVVFTSVLR
jgi:TetR/AcrR family transcriptional regulator, transcriptional repressor for nem operon